MINGRLTPDLKKRIEDKFLEKLSLKQDYLKSLQAEALALAADETIEELGFNKQFSSLSRQGDELKNEVSRYVNKLNQRLLYSPEYTGFISDERFFQEEEVYWSSDVGKAEKLITLIDTLIKRYGVFVSCEYYLKTNIVNVVERLRANKHLKRLGLTNVLKNEDSPEKDYGC